MAASPVRSVTNVRSGSKLGRTQSKQMSSGLSLKDDIALYSWHVSNVPLSD